MSVAGVLASASELKPGTTEGPELDRNPACGAETSLTVAAGPATVSAAVSAAAARGERTCERKLIPVTLG